MKIKIVMFVQIILLLAGCGVNKGTDVNLTGTYSYSNDYANYQIKIVNDSILKISQTFKCEKLPENMKFKEISVLYKVEKAKVYRHKNNIKIYGVKNLKLSRVNLLNLSENSIEYPIFEEGGSCSIFSEMNRNDRKIFDGRTIFSPFNKENILDFKNKFFIYNYHDNTIVFAIKNFEMVQINNIPNYSE